MKVGALALDTSLGYMQVRGVMPMQIVQQQVYIQLVSKRPL